MSDEPPVPNWRRSKRPRSIASGTYGFPLHPAVVNVPIGAWFASLVFDVGSRVGGPSEALATGAAWLMGIGVAGALVAALLGFMDLIQVPAGTYVMRLGIVHMGINLTATTAYVADLMLRLGDPRGGTPPALIVFSAVSFAVLAAGSHLGGSLTYAFGVRVVDESAQRPGYDAIPGGGR